MVIVVPQKMWLFPTGSIFIHVLRIGVTVTVTVVPEFILTNFWTTVFCIQSTVFTFHPM